MTPQEKADPTRVSMSADHAEFAASLGNGWNNYSSDRTSDDNTAARTVSADPTVGGTGRSDLRYQTSPWRQGTTASGYVRHLPTVRKAWAEETIRNILISTFLASRPGEAQWIRRIWHNISDTGISSAIYWEMVPGSRTWSTVPRTV